MTNSTQTVSAYQFQVFDKSTGRTISWCRSQKEADAQIARWQKHCERRHIEFQAIIIQHDQTPEEGAQ